MKKVKYQETVQDRTTARLLSEKLQSLTADECLPLEAIAQLVEKKISGKQQDRMMSHLARCSSCYETFLLSSQIHSEPHPEIKTTEKSVFFRPLALAASVVVLVVSLVVVHTSGILNKTPGPDMEKAEVKKDTHMVSVDPTQEKSEGLVDRSRKKGLRGKSRTKGAPKEIDDLKFKYQTVPDTQREIKLPLPPESRDHSPAHPAAISPVEKNALKIAESQEKELTEEMSRKKKPETDRIGLTESQDSLKRSEADEQLGFSRITSRHPNGAIKILNRYQQSDKKNILEEIREYDPAGQNTLIRNLFTGSLIKMGYHESGQLKFREEYLQGKPHGTWMKWDDQGRIIEKQIYEKGKLIKIFK
jgi:hypothetical protein